MTEGAKLKLECNILRKMKPTVFVANGPVISRRVNVGLTVGLCHTNWNRAYVCTLHINWVRISFFYIAVFQLALIRHTSLHIGMMYSTPLLYDCHKIRSEGIYIVLYLSFFQM